MSGTLRVTVDSAAVSLSKALAASARLAPLLVITHRAFADLAEELGGYEQAVRYLLKVATTAGKPIGVNALTGPDGSRTWFVAPMSWSREKAAGWIAAYHAELERAFGDATPI